MRAIALACTTLLRAGQTGFRLPTSWRMTAGLARPWLRVVIPRVLRARYVACRLVWSGPMSALHRGPQEGCWSRPDANAQEKLLAPYSIWRRTRAWRSIFQNPDRTHLSQDAEAGVVDVLDLERGGREDA